MSLPPPVKLLYKHGNLLAKAKIGLEVHAQLNIRSKLFSQGLNSSQTKSNSQLDLLDIALPGSLPKLNKNAVRAAILSSIGFNCKIQEFTHFDRKNYFYTDMPAGFQITQYNNPIARDGFIEFIVKTHHKSVIAHSERYDIVKCLFAEDRGTIEEIEPYIRRSRIKQVQLEQDSAKTLVQTSRDYQEREIGNLIDYCRSGVGLIEIVFEPDLSNHHEAASLVKELITILKALKTCDCELQEGSLRVDANVSIENIDNEIIESARVELKNLNSLKALSKGISYEIQRQTALISDGKKVIQETRTFDSRSNSTRLLRIKETAVDYRYVPEPSIPPLLIEQDLVDEVKQELPKNMTIDLRKKLLEELKLDLILIAETLEENGLSEFLLAIMKNKPEYDANVVADFMIYTMANLKDLEVSSMEVDLVNQGSQFLQRFTPEKMQLIFDMLFKEQINYCTAFELIKYIFVSNSDKNPKEIVEQFDWFQINDRKVIVDMCSDLRKKMKNISKKYAVKGDKRQLRLMLNKLSELTNDKINIKLAIEVLDSQLKPPKQVQ